MALSFAFLNSFLPSGLPPHTLHLKIITILILFISQQLKTLQRDKFTIKIVFVTTFNKFQGQTLKTFCNISTIASLYPHAHLCVTFFRPSLFGYIAAEITEGHWQRIENAILMTSSTVYREVFESFDYINKS